MAIEDGHQPDGSDMAASARHRGMLWVPVVVFAVIAGLFGFALRSGDPSKLPSALIGKPAPEMTLPAMVGLRDGTSDVPGFSAADLKSGAPTVVNFFASWCVPCVQEHPVLLELRARTGVRLVGVNYKDPEPGGRRFLGRYGNPFTEVGIDDSGRAALEWGVYGMPETFVVDGQGRVTAKHVGPLTLQTLAERIIPAIEAARK